MRDWLAEWQTDGKWEMENAESWAKRGFVQFVWVAAYLAEYKSKSATNCIFLFPSAGSYNIVEIQKQPLQPARGYFRVLCSALILASRRHMASSPQNFRCVVMCQNFHRIGGKANNFPGVVPARKLGHAQWENGSGQKWVVGMWTWTWCGPKLVSGHTRCPIKAEFATH